MVFTVGTRDSILATVKNATQPMTSRLIASHHMVKPCVVKAVLFQAKSTDPKIQLINRSPYNSTRKRPVWFYTRP